MRILFFHGGPGLNSNPEKKLLSGPFAEAGIELVCWNEPSVLRGDEGPSAERAYDHYLEEAEGFFLRNHGGAPAVVMAHSFGANAACHIARKHPEKLAHIVFVCTDLAPALADRNVFRFVAADYEKEGDARCEELRRIIELHSGDRRPGHFDADSEAGYGLVVQNPRWFDYYWLNRERMAQFGPYLGEPGFTVDVEGFFNVRRVYRELEMSPVSIPATAIFGKHDPVVSRETELSILRSRFPALRIHEFQQSGHYPHIEETEKFLNTLRQELGVRETELPPPSSFRVSDLSGGRDVLRPGE